nr:hypothetical protein [Enemella evansiae]
MAVLVGVGFGVGELVGVAVGEPVGVGVPDPVANAVGDFSPGWEKYACRVPVTLIRVPRSSGLDFSPHWAR